MKKENLQKAIALRRELHRHPELSGGEEWTREHLKEFLRRNTSLRIVDKGRWFYAWYDPADREDGRGDRRDDGCEDYSDEGSGHGTPPTKKQPGPRSGIAFRADFDALPIQDDIDADYKSVNEGIGHKCGHDGHAATLAALALEVDADGAERDVFFLFQHAEETGEGAKECLEIFREHGIGEIYAYHNMPGIPLGPPAAIAALVPSVTIFNEIAASTKIRSVLVFILSSSIICSWTFSIMAVLL
jgi:metal-dependent amidase/aminoacylase/carboxypeptidase family protein